MRFGEFKQEILKHNPNANLDLIKKAFDLSKREHGTQKRASGEDYFEHPVAVALKLAQLKADSATICAGLLHDLIEDTKITFNDIKIEFGQEIAALVEGVTKVNKNYFSDKDSYNAENFRKILLATSKDIRVMFIKLADRLHNMQTLKYFKEEKQKRIAKETLEIYAPIAHKLGMWYMKGELEDLSLRYLQPETYQYLRDKVSGKRSEREKQTKEIIKVISRKLKENGIEAKVYGRAKFFYSIYKKMMKKNLKFDQIYDLIAVRVLTNSKQNCYAALNIIHEMWEPIGERFKDYISIPKANEYQSLHTTVKGDNKIIEFQIRTDEMHQIAEHGIAAHWKYHGTERDKKFEKKISWIKQLLDWRNQEDAHEFIESLKLDLFHNEIVVFTPKGDPISLREGSTPVDFAFEVHTNIGLTCSKANVNGKSVTLDYNLKPGDVTEIITSKNAKPSRNWLKFVKTSKAKTKLRSYLRIDGEVLAKVKNQQLDSKDAILSASGIIISDEKFKKLPIKLSKCCEPKGNETIIGFLTKDKKITVHVEGCPNIHTLDQNKKINLSWSRNNTDKAGSIGVSVNDSPGILGEILSILITLDFKISNIVTKAVKDHIYIMISVSNPTDSKIEKAINTLRDHKEVIDVKEVEE